MCHADNVTIKNITVRNASGHCHEFAGCKNILVENCRYEGLVPSGTLNYLECIQPDLMQEASFHYGGKYDGTMTKNVVIRNCYFG
jgi:polygalacturonase